MQTQAQHAFFLHRAEKKIFRGECTVHCNNKKIHIQIKSPKPNKHPHKKANKKIHAHKTNKQTKTHQPLWILKHRHGEHGIIFSFRMQHPMDAASCKKLTPRSFISFRNLYTIQYLALLFWMDASTNLRRCGIEKQIQLRLPYA
jgi:hypothetical protein